MSVVLSEHLPLLASAPDGIQKLRGLILELAVRGKLVSQEPDNDQSSWKRGLFSDFFSLEYGDNLPAPKRSGTGEYPVYGSNGVAGTHNECRVQRPCIVVGRKGSAGALNLCRGTGCWVTDVAYYCIPPSGVDLDFAFVLFHTLGLDNLGKGIKPGLSRNEAYSLPVEIPSLAEQHRIVAKVDELMALCDRLETEQADAASAHARLVETLLGTLTQSTDAADLAANWQRLAEHFDTLFTTEASIDSLKQTVLKLAVTGFLVPSDRAKKPETGKLGDYVDFLNGYAFKSEWFRPSGVRLLRNANVGHGMCDWRDTVYLPADRLAEFDRFCLHDGDLVLSLDRPIINSGLKIARVSTKDLPCLLLQRVAKVVPRDEMISLEYLYLWFNSPVFLSVIDPGRSNGVPHISTKQVAGLTFIRYPLEEQQRIVTKVDELMALCDRLKAGLSAARQHQATLADTLIESAL